MEDEVLVNSPVHNWARIPFPQVYLAIPAIKASHEKGTRSVETSLLKFNRKVQLKLGPNIHDCIWTKNT